MKIVLASGSPRRRELLRQIGVEAVVVPSSVDEVIRSDRPDRVVMDLASCKALDVAVHCQAGTIVIGADTVVSVDGRILGKPGSCGEAAEMIRLLQGRSHQVYTGVDLILCEENGMRSEHAFVEMTQVRVNSMDEDEILRYSLSGEPLDKAGAYGIQGRFAAFIGGITGDYNNVVGLPVSRVYQELKRLGWREQEHD